jgi:hypothetical protein
MSDNMGKRNSRLVLAGLACMICMTILLSDRPCLAARPTPARRQAFVNAGLAFLNAAVRDDAAGIRGLFTPDLARTVSVDSLRPVMKIFRDVHGVKKVDCVYVLGRAGSVLVTGQNRRMYLNLSLIDGKIAGFTYHELKRGETMIVPMPQRRYQAIAAQVVAAVNAGDIAAIEGLCSAYGQKMMPPETAGPVFAKLREDVGRIGKVDLAVLNLDVATFNLTGDAGSTDADICLDAHGKIAYMLFHNTSSTSPTVLRRPLDDYTAVARKVADGINRQDVAAIEALFAPNVSGQLPPDKAAVYFAEVLKSCGLVKDVRYIGHYGDASAVALIAERSKLIFSFSIDAEARVTWFELTVTKQDAAPASKAVRIIPALHLTKPGEMPQ